mmetsp:Transcript_68485/g.135344  ORF Transcript_68485/g.135344 Transcript_68485/m.135344 type:complete len:261 (-) Transcript_68485:63-845(-)
MDGMHSRESEGAMETSSGSQSSSYGGDSESIGEDDTVYDLRCDTCSRLVCRRGLCVQLVSDNSARLFSTDFRPLSVLEAEEEHEHGLCRCRIRDVSCECGSILGYHVIQPCTNCNETGHNDHYWLLYPNSELSRERPLYPHTDRTRQLNLGAVTAEPRLNNEGQRLTWCGNVTASLDLDQSGQPNAGPVTEPGVAVETGSFPVERCCPICHEAMANPMAPPCQHAACLRCLTRAVDLRRCCPFCRRPTTCAELVPVTLTS